MKPIQALVLAAIAAPAAAQITLVPGATDTGLTAFNAVGSEQRGNYKSYLEDADGLSTRLQGNTISTQWWVNTERSWEVVWDDSTETVTFNIYSDNAYTNLADSISRSLSLGGNSLVNLNIGARIVDAEHSVTYSGVEFDGGSGFAAVPSANATYTGNGFYTNFHTLAGPRGDFTLRGVSLLADSVDSITSTSDRFRFFVVAQTPAPGSLALLGLGGLAATRRRR